jgi:hypothetical protein
MVAGIGFEPHCLSERYTLPLRPFSSFLGVHDLKDFFIGNSSQGEWSCTVAFIRNDIYQHLVLELMRWIGLAGRDALTLP